MAKAVKKIITRGVIKKNFPKILITTGDNFNAKIFIDGHEIKGIINYKIKQESHQHLPILTLEIEAVSFEYHTEGERGPINIQYYDVELDKMVEITNIAFKEKIIEAGKPKDQENHNPLDDDVPF